MKTTFDKKLLIEVLSIQSKSNDDKVMMDYLESKIKTIAKNAIVTKDEYGNIYVTKGKAKLYPCLVSHTDTVHKIHADFKVYEQNNILFAFSATEGGQVGIGGDDKNGVFICLSALKDLENCKLVFFRNEEVGCLGSKEANMDFFNDCTIVAQADRRNHSGFVTKAGSVELSSEAFLTHITPILKAHEYEPVQGSVTDVMTLKQKGLDVCAFNIECAYYNPHSDAEIVHIENLEDCYETVMEIIDITKKERWLHKYEAPSYSSGNNYMSRHQHSSYHDRYDGYTGGELPFTVTDDTTDRKDIISHRRLGSDLISDDPKEVNSYLNTRQSRKSSQADFIDVESIDNDSLSEEIQLWEEVMITKGDYDSAIEDYQEHMNEKIEKAGRI